MTNLLNTETTKKQLNLFDPFFNKELTHSNDYITYIECNTSNQHIVHSSAVTSDVKKTSASNNIKMLLKENTKFSIINPLSHKAIVSLM